MSGNDLVVLKNRKLISETEQAILIGDKHTPLRYSGMRGKTWIPRVFVSDPFPFDDIGAVADVEIPRWVAEQNDLDHEEV